MLKCECAYKEDMKISYKKLWELLIDSDTRKRDLKKAAGLVII